MTNTCDHLTDSTSLATKCKTADSATGKRIVLSHIQVNDVAKLKEIEDESKESNKVIQSSVELFLSWQIKSSI